MHSLPSRPPYLTPKVYRRIGRNDEGELGNGGSSKLLLGLSIRITVLIPTAAQESLENDSEMWNMYRDLDEVKEEDNRITDAWKANANTSLVVFVSHNLDGLCLCFISVTSPKTGLISAIVGVVIVEFYKKLFSDSGDQTVALQQISHQLPESPNSTYVNTATQLSFPGTAMVWVNALWLISLVLSLIYA